MKPELNKDEIIEEQAKEIAELRGKLALVLNEIERLKSMIRNDSNNSSLPPSSTQKGKNRPMSTTDERRERGKQAGKRDTKEPV